MKSQFIICLLNVFYFQISLAQVGNLYFKDITTEDGLSNNLVTCITQDSMGFMWFGTAYGLNRYDGNEFKIYYHDPKDPQSISWNAISSILEDSKGNLWIGTGGRGLNRFDRDQDKFISYRYDKDDSTSLSNEDELAAVYEDRQGQLWIGTSYGLNRYNAEKDNFIRYTHIIGDTNSINPEPIRCIYEDSRNNFWVGTYGGGLELFDRETGKVIHFMHDAENPNSIRDNYICSIFEESGDTICIGTDNGYDRMFYSNDKAIFKHVKNTKAISTEVSSTEVFDFYERPGSKKLINAYQEAEFIDNFGNIWIGTRYEGVKYCNNSCNFFQTYKYKDDEPGGLKNRSVLAICETSDGMIWIGVDHGGLHLYDRGENTFTYVPLDPQEQDNPFVESIMTIEEDNFGDLWVGTWGKGAYRLEKKSGIWIHYIPEENKNNCLNFPIVGSILMDNRQNIWLGTVGGGVNIYDRKNDSFNQITELRGNDAYTESFGLSKIIYQIYEDNEENLWFCTGWGLYLFDRDNKIFKNWVHDRNDTTSISGLHVQLAYEDSKGNLWVGTWLGLNLFNRKDGTFTRYETKDGLPSNDINGILEDNHSNLWISTSYGISKFDPENETFKNYNVDDGLQGQKFNARAFAKLKTGEFVFGGTNGFTIFHPDSIRDFKTIPPVVITNFRIFNKSVRSGDNDSPLQKDICLANEIILPHYKNSISFEFAVLDYVNPVNNKYKYFLEGFHKDWVETSSDHRVAAFTKLNPGTYVFRVKGSNGKGVWNNEGAKVKIIITPPWWKTTLAYILYILLTGFIIWVIWKTQLRRVHLRHELEMKQFETDKLQELDQMKSRFFANISHEIRTPLTLILGPLEQIISEASKEKLKKQIQIMSRNGRNLLRLINQLLDFSKLESGRMSLKAREINIVPLLKGMVYSFDSLAKRKRIKLTFKCEEDVIPVYIDSDKLEKIMANLLSNAFKFTSEGGKISVQLSVTRNENKEYESGSTEDKIIEIRVKDTGIGIAPQHLDYIFDRYYQVDSKDERTGTGIGLALTRELVELHHGRITAESKPGKGTTFIIRFLSGKDHLKSDEIIEHITVEDFPVITMQEEAGPSIEDDIKPSIETIESHYVTTGKRTTGAKKELPVLLIVEDTEDVRNYIRGFMESDYQISEAQDGDDGFEKATEIIPDLIISDVMMPKMDGFKLCEKLKTDERTSHIPVILLTARASEASKLEGLETGADEYLIKPFSAKELTIRVKNLIDQRRKLRERFAQDITLSPKDITVTSADERFLERAMGIIEKHMGDPEFGVDIFGKEIGLSHSQLHRKIRALTNLSPVEFIRTLRLKRAASLLRQEYGNVAEVAYEVGFNNPSYFAECFRKLFGKSPSEYTA
jgi:signal transduction histidine kinase/ligand-binding sensor domain-containing protein/DNA-binding NarL/FixJ family response regulator